jgi:UDP-3-O-[3-hydroxymyristoyl] glucosamine N-acyltransferase
MTDEPLTLRRIAEIVGGTVEGDGSVVVEAIAALDQAGPADLTFADVRHARGLAASKARAAIVERGSKAAAAAIPMVRVDNAQLAVFRLLSHLAGPEDLPPAGIDPTARVAPDAKIAQAVAIGPGVVIGPRAAVGDRSVLCAHAFVGRGVVIGQDCMLAEGVVVRADCRVGSRVRIGSNSVIGYDGFGYWTEAGVHHRVPHVGNVVIEDDVDIGACSCVDRAKFGSTRIGAGTKIDNLVQIAHNVQIGRGCVLAGQCGIAGSAKLGRYVVVGGNAGIRDNVTLGDGVQCSAFAAVASDVPDGQGVAGIPAGPAREKLREIQAGAKLPGLLKRVKDLEAKVNALESPKDH